MIILVLRYSGSSESTLGVFLIDGEFYCHTLEDPVREVKIPGITAIPGGDYRLILRYSNRFKREMIAVEKVPGFTGILIHILNTAIETEGCIGVGNTANNNRHAKGRLFNSRDAYNEIFEIIAPVIRQGEEVRLVIGNPMELLKFENRKEVA
jgi:hypothetical protein